ncbi:MAG: carbon-nitrogen hydrolase family protein [Planctomycetota bacterium]|jgi:N-carbamoylputrescine amidase|nr:carbon-nitrogen hydrolase family protein [Planctomycetota bacterium]
MYRTIKVAAISMKPVKWEKAANADRMEDFFRRAAGEKVQVALAPEGVLEGYVTNEIIADPSLADRMPEAAEKMDGPYIKRFQELAKKLKTCLCFGFAEKTRDGVYNCSIFVDTRGNICGRHHKAQLAEGYHDSWDFNRIGKRLRAFETPFGKAGFLICNERWNPRIARTLVMDGARALYIPSFGSRSKSQNENVLARSRENGVPIVEANVGVNMIISKGEVVAYKWGCDQLTIGEIDISELPSPRNARKMEREYLKVQAGNMKKNYRKTVARLKKNSG